MVAIWEWLAAQQLYVARQAREVVVGLSDQLVVVLLVLLAGVGHVLLHLFHGGAEAVHILLFHVVLQQHVSEAVPEHLEHLKELLPEVLDGGLMMGSGPSGNTPPPPGQATGTGPGGASYNSRDCSLISINGDVDYFIKE